MTYELKNNKSNLIENNRDILLKKDLELLQEKSKNADLEK